MHYGSWKSSILSVQGDCPVARQNPIFLVTAQDRETKHTQPLHSLHSRRLRALIGCGLLPIVSPCKQLAFIERRLVTNFQ